MKTFLAIVLSFTVSAGFANMASPITQGTISTAPFTSGNIDIIKEVLIINIDRYFKTAAFSIDYFISADTAGKQIPLLFYAKNYKSDFKIWVDDAEVVLIDIPSTYRLTANTPFAGFAGAFTTTLAHEDGEYTQINWGKNNGGFYRLNELKYFEIALAKGTHKIHVSYVAEVTTDRSGWIKKYNFPYSLSPAKYWKSFGGLDVILNTAQATEGITTNLGTPASGKTDSMAVWHFNKMPADFVDLSYTPVISPFAAFLLKMEPIGLTTIFGILAAVLHILLISWYRRKEVHEKYSPVVIAGSIIIPVLLIIMYMYSYSIIDNAIGVNASRRHGYTFFSIIFYPLILAVYWGVMWVADVSIKSRLLKQGIA